jgi:predicted transcriptional regulator
MAERDALLAQREAEIAALRAGLAHAEALAFARQDELNRIHASLAWKALRAAARMKMMLRGKADGVS